MPDIVTNVLYQEIDRLRARVKELEATPDFARGFNAGREATLRRNPSGCCCKFTDEKDGEDIISMCEAHKEHFEHLEADNQRLRAALEHIEEYWNGDYNEKAMSDACDAVVEIAREALRED